MNILHVAPISKNITSGLSNSVYNLVEAQSHNYGSIGIISSKKTDNYFSNKIKFMQIGDLSVIHMIFFFLNK